MRGTQVTFADALAACHHLQPRDQATVGMIVELLQLHAEPAVAPATPSLGAFKPSSRDTGRVARHQLTIEDRRPSPAPTPATARLAEAPPSLPGTASRLRRVGDAAISLAPLDWSEGDELSPDAAGRERQSPPLFSRVQRRGLLGSAIATLVEEGDLDVDAIVADLSRREPLPRLPRLLSLTTRRGLQLLIDRGAGMDPFADDVRQLRRALDDILADDRLEVLDFWGCPSRGVLEAGGDEPAPWRPPPPGTPVLCVTDLGLGGPRADPGRATAHEWLDFARGARRDGHVVAALVPYEATRWPPRLARAMPLLHWSERTTVGEVRRAMRDARERLRR